jgi:UDP-N-acetylglucosamine 2-epimerase (non-hydrolysing)
MSKTFFEELNIPKPDTNLNCGGGTQAEQTAAIMIAFERELEQHPTDLVLVVGDVTSTMACSIVAKKMRTPVTHVEAGIRSYDLSMPEEINRMVTDSITDYFFTTSRKANENLRKLGVEEERIFFVGNVMIDTLLANRTRFRAPAVWDELGLVKGEYFVMTMHRPANVDEEKKLKIMIEEIVEGARGLPILFPMHPRSQRIFAKLDINYDSLKAIEPLGYLEFNYLVENSKAVLTDSGGITEETTVMGIPCMTIRDNTERPETIPEGTNKLVGTDPANIRQALDELFTGEWKTGSIPELWDGKAAERMVEKIAQLPLHVS